MSKIDDQLQIETLALHGGRSRIPQPVHGPYQFIKLHPTNFAIPIMRLRFSD